MTQPYDDDDQDQDQRNWRRKLEDDAKAGREAQAKLAEQEAASRAMQQELAMRRAGIDPDHPVAVLLAKANPTLVDVDSIKAEWDKVQPAAPAVPVEQQQAMQRIQDAQAGGDPSGGASPDFEAELDSIPLLGPDGQYNPNYVQQVLSATQIQAAREGREFTTSGGKITSQQGYSLGPATVPIRGE